MSRELLNASCIYMVYDAFNLSVQRSYTAIIDIKSAT